MGQRCGDYELLRHIATGGMAEIHLARHHGGLDRTLVIKRMLPELAVRPDFVEMFLDEARLTASLQHPHVVRVEQLGQADGAWFIAMELVDGPHLGGLFANSLRSRKPLPVELCTFIVARAADGLDYAHSLNDPSTGRPLNLVHRDISPQNILVSRHGEVKVTDFGVAKSSTQQTKTRTGIVKGKVSYMSPEQCLGDAIDHRTDVFALGVVLYELLTRKRLFRDKSDLLVMQRITNEDVAPPSTVNSAIDPILDGIVKKSLDRNAARRYQTAAEFAEALDAWLLKSGRQADELTLAQWFAAHCPELAQTATLGPAEPTVASFAPPPHPEVTAATPSFATRGVQREAARLKPPPRGSEATTITAPPTFDTAIEEVAGLAGEPRSGNAHGETLETSAPEPPAPIPERPELVSQAAPPARSPSAPGSRAPLIAAGLAALCVAGVAVALVASRAPTAPVVAVVPTTQASLIVETTPPGVPVVVGDRAVGASPVTVTRGAGLVIVQVEFPNQPVQQREVALPASGEVKVRFEARVPLIVRSTPPKARVRIGGELLGETPFDRGYLVEPGTPIALRLDPPTPAWQAVERDIVAAAGTPLEVDIELPSIAKKPGGPVPPVDVGMGRLSIRTDPPVVVSLGKDALDETPFAERPVRAGKHVLVLKSAEKGLDERLPVTIVKDKTLIVILKYTKEGVGWKLQSKTIR